MLAARLGAWLRNTGEKWARTSFAEKLALLLALLAVIYTVVTGAAELRYQARAREALGCTRRFGTALSLTQGLFGMSWAALTALAVCGILLSVALIDAETQLIPDRLNLALAVCGVVGTLLSPAGWLPHLIGAFCVSVPMLLLCLVIDGAFGGGDIKLMAAAGLFLGWQNTLLAMFLGILGGGLYGIWLLAAKRADKKDHFAFGPFLCAGIVIAMLFGEPILQWYCAFL